VDDLKTNIKIYKAIIVLVALCGCETWSFTSRDEYRPRVFEDWMLRKIFRTKREEVVTRR